MTIGSWPKHISPLIWRAFKQKLKRSTRPILAGPFRGEVGFETLYWIPFLKALEVDPERLIPITRGGAAAWYPAKHAVELYALRDPRSVRVENLRQQQATGLLKQVTPTVWDRSVVQDAAKAAGVTAYDVISPSWMYRVLWPFWETQRGISWLQQHTSYTPLPAPPLPEGIQLPPVYLTARFYYRPTWPACDLTTQIGESTVRHLAQKMPVVLLSGGVHADEHVDQPFPVIPNVFDLRHLTTLTPQTNLAVQSAVLKGSQGFIGTYGGLAQLGLSLGVPTISLYTEWQQTCLAHKHLTDLLGQAYKVTTHVLKVADIPSLQQTFPTMTLVAEPRGSSGAVVGSKPKTPGL